MKTIRWTLEKAKLVKEIRNIDFERVASLIISNNIQDIRDVPNRINQKMFILNYDGYAICVLFVTTQNEIFIKTAYKSRKLNKKMRGEL
ncbi:MAG: toxin [Gammaproteobacteria bacterium]|nr:toxin [Gammaproteobacteria bacterium]